MKEEVKEEEEEVVMVAEEVVVVDGEHLVEMLTNRVDRGD